MKPSPTMSSLKTDAAGSPVNPEYLRVGNPDTLKMCMSWLKTYEAIYNSFITLRIKSPDGQGEILVADEKLLWGKQQAEFGRASKIVIHSLKLIPGFTGIALRDQLTLVQINTSGLLISMFAYTYNPDLNTFRFLNLSDKEMALTMHMFPELEPVTEVFLNLTQALHREQLDSFESAMFWILVMLLKTEEDFINEREVEKCRDTVLSHLQHYTDRKGNERFFSIMLMMSEVRIISTVVQEAFSQFMANHPNVTEVLDPLFKDMVLRNIVQSLT